jgi:uncharacterized damage-inducible protein DinB
MLTTEHAVKELASTEAFFNRSTETLTEADSDFRPTPDMMSVANQVAHTAMTIDWFIDGGIGGHWDMDFESGAARVNAVTSLTAARALLAKAFDRARRELGAKTAAELAAPMAENPIMNGPVYHLIEGIVDHTGHHRGVLTVYARLRGQVPPMPYDAA